MASSPSPIAPRTCLCGCGADVAREFKPGHDAKFKSALVAATKSSDWWVREAAVATLISRRWGHFAAAADLAKCPIRVRVGGRFVTTRHIEAVGGAWIASGMSHSTNECVKIEGKMAFGSVDDGFACGTCIHTSNTTEIAAKAQMQNWTMKGSAFAMAFGSQRAA